MPKQRTHSGAKKRFKVTKSGKVKFTHAGRRHILNKKTTKRKRAMRKPGFAGPTNAPQIKVLIPYM